MPITPRMMTSSRPGPGARRPVSCRTRTTTIPTVVRRGRNWIAFATVALLTRFTRTHLSVWNERGARPVGADRFVAQRGITLACVPLAGLGAVIPPRCLPVRSAFLRTRLPSAFSSRRTARSRLLLAAMTTSFQCPVVIAGGRRLARTIARLSHQPLCPFRQHHPTHQRSRRVR